MLIDMPADVYERAAARAVLQSPRAINSAFIWILAGATSAGLPFRRASPLIEGSLPARTRRPIYLHMLMAPLTRPSIDRDLRAAGRAGRSLKDFRNAIQFALTIPGAGRRPD